MHEHTNIDQRTLDLLNGGIDGELSTADQAELDTLLAGSDQVRDINDDLNAFTSVLDELPELEPPGFLQSAIERQIRLPVHKEHQQKKLAFLNNWLPTHWLRTGFALAAGAVLTIGVYEMGSEPISGSDATSMMGTVIKAPSNNHGVLLDSISISTNTLNGLVELRNNDDLFTLDVQLSSDAPTRLVVDFEGRGLEFEGVTRQEDREDTVAITNGVINVTSSGEQRYRLTLRRSSDEQQAAPLELRFYASNALVHEAE